MYKAEIKKCNYTSIKENPISFTNKSTVNSSKKRRHNSNFLLSIILLLLITASVCPVIAGATTNVVFSDYVEGSNYIEFTITAEEPSFTETDNGELMEILGFENYGVPGEPSLPSLPLSIALPADADLSTIGFEIVSSSTASIDGIHEIMPAQPNVILASNETIVDYGTDAEIVDGKNTFIYSLTTSYPENIFTITSKQESRGVRSIKSLYVPVRYIPSEKTVSYIPETKIKRLSLTSCG